MKLIHCRFSSGQRVPTRSVHLHPTQTQAPRLPSAAAHLPAIQAFYTYAQSRDAHLDGVILVCHFEAILALLDGKAVSVLMCHPLNAARPSELNRYG